MYLFLLGIAILVGENEALQDNQKRYLSNSHYLPVLEYDSYYANNITLNLDILGGELLRKIFMDDLNVGWVKKVEIFFRKVTQTAPEAIKDLAVGYLNIEDTLKRIHKGKVECHLANLENLIIELDNMITLTEGESSEQSARKKRLH